MADSSDVKQWILDPTQLNRIESIHRGFLYQHLYAVGCLLLSSTSGLSSLFVETDEDIELIFPDRHLYIQVKTRTLPLQTADISKTLVHFDQLRKTHLDGKRPLVPSFYIVSNIKPNHELAEKMKSVDWGNDIFLLWPNCPVGSPVTIPPCWSDLSEALTWCIEKAGSGSI